MAKCGITNISGGGGIGSDELSVTADKVVEGNTYVGSDTNDEIGTGTLVDRPSTVSAQSVAQGLSGGGNYIFTRIPTGAYRTPTNTGYPEITALSSTVATAGGLSSDKMLAGKTAFGINGTATSDANVTPSQMLSGSFGYANGNKIAGNIASLGAQTINPTASQQIVSTSGKYLTGNVTVNGVSNLTAANIKKGVNVGGTVGNFEGYVPTATDLYLRGNNIAGFTATNSASAVSFESGGIKIYRAGPELKSASQVNFTPYNYLNIETYYENYVNTIGDSKTNFKMIGTLWDGTTTISTGISSNITEGKGVTFSIPVSALSLTRIVHIRIYVQYDALGDNSQWVTYTTVSWNGYVYRIWMS